MAGLGSDVNRRFGDQQDATMKINALQPPGSRPPASDELLSQWVDQVRHVRQRMVLQALLKILALGLVAVPLYVTGFAWLDHHLHLGPILRLLALGGMIAGCTYLFWLGLKMFRTHISLSCAANAVEAKHCLDQQLVAAIEYYEQQDDYPYSRGLVEQMIRGLDEQVRDTNFKDTVPAWPSWLCSGVVFISLVAIVYLLLNHMQYYGRYLTRLVQPTAAVAPLPATELTNLTGPLLAAPQESFQMKAALSGRLPERGQLVIEADPNNPENENLVHTLPLPVTHDANDQAELAATWSLGQMGDYRYRFLAGDAQSDWQTITITEFPAVTSMKAQVTFGSGEARQTTQEEIQANTLSVYERAEVELTVQTSQPLNAARADIPRLGQVPATLDPNGFHLSFTVQEAGPVVFDLINTAGHPNRADQRLEVLLKKDQPPRIELLSPDGDYVGTNVASLPIRFAVSDDMGLDTASITLELKDGQQHHVDLEVLPNSRTAEGLYELELEQYDLEISDSILFYAQARDASTLHPYLHQESVTEPYFIEIRPYRQWIHQLKPGMPNMPKQGLEMQAAHDSLMAVLEYTRAFLKKTWPLAQLEEFSEPDKKHLTAISSDIDYAAEQLALIRDDPRYDFSEEQVAQINRVRQHFANASKFVCTFHPQQALAPEKQGYFELRNLIKELEKGLMPPGQTPPPPQQRDRYAIEEQLHVKRYDQERLEWELEQINQKLAELAREQDKLKQEFLNFLEQQKQVERNAQQAHGRDSWQEEKPVPATAGAMLPPENPDQSQGSSSLSTEGAQAWLEPDPNRTSPPSGGGGNQPQPAQAGELMRMMQAQEKALQEQLEQLSQELESLPLQGQDQRMGQSPSNNPHRQEAQAQLQQAGARMDEFDETLNQQYYQAEPDAEALSQANDLLDQTEDHLSAAREALAQEVGDDDTLAALRAESLAKQLEDLARNYDPSVSLEEQQTMQELLQQATALLEQMPEDWWKQTSRDMPATPTAQRPPGPIQVGMPRGNGGGSGMAGKADGLGSDTRQRMQQLAQSFWSVSMEVQKEASPQIQSQVSHPQYSEMENLFFELSAAQKPEQP